MIDSKHYFIFHISKYLENFNKFTEGEEKNLNRQISDDERFLVQLLEHIWIKWFLFEHHFRSQIVFLLEDYFFFKN